MGETLELYEINGDVIKKVRTTSGFGRLKKRVITLWYVNDKKVWGGKVELNQKYGREELKKARVF
jgi:hypothetical protein